MKKESGFTLIEILIALAVFAILASITSSTLYYAFNTRTRVNEQSERLSALQLAISIVQQDISQTAERAIRGNDMRLFPIFTGRPDYVEFTRDGDVNPGSIEKRSTLKRIALVCQNDSLLRRTWDTLDPFDRNTHADKVLISHLSDCHFGYLNQSLQVFPEWRADAVNQDQNKESLPKAIQVNLNVKKLGELNLLFTIPGALYANS
ncbi:GspJ family T2SS minor pseudopilin variant LspJ [Legionella lytica]|uniref:Type II secretion system protein J n=1 Tax=Legionella lytica TaxID=96232 RepID=A0ABY4Y5U1_9GAMM|nr:GspJ family T2SS minor pseudopilin variant LspJ [Legionella lytica]USQ12940.1 GspJ family T2SS minor pseudopilin variant LspJ [Legionella lytica]